MDIYFDPFSCGRGKLSHLSSNFFFFGCVNLFCWIHNLLFSLNAFTSTFGLNNKGMEKLLKKWSLRGFYLFLQLRWPEGPIQTEYAGTRIVSEPLPPKAGLLLSLEAFHFRWGHNWSLLYSRKLWFLIKICLLLFMHHYHRLWSHVWGKAVLFLGTFYWIVVWSFIFLKLWD